MAALGSAPVMVGRESGLERVDALLAAVMADGRAAGCLVLGPAGIGKSTFLGAALDACARQRWRTLVSRPAASETGFDHAGLADLLRDVSDDSIDALPGPQARALRVALRREEPGPDPPDPLAVALAFTTLVGALVEEAPVLVAVDDAPWLDGPTHRILAFALRRLGRTRLAVLLTARPSGPDPTGLLRDTLDPGAWTVLELGPLSLAAIHEVLRDGLGLAAPRPLLIALVDASRGNPLHALELGRLVVAAARAAGEPPNRRTWDRLDPTARFAPVDPLLDRRVTDLAVSTREILAAAALLAAPTHDLLLGLGGEARDGVRAAIEAGIVALDGDRIRFDHPLLAEAAIRTMPGPRPALHAQLAALPLAPDERARHLARADDRPDAATAERIEAGARHALERGAPDGAAELYLAARSRTPPDDLDAAARRGVEGALCLWTAGDPQAVRAILGDVLATAPPGRQRARAWQLLGWVTVFEDGHPAALAIADDMLAAAVDDPDLAAFAHLHAAVVAQDDDRELALRHVQDARRLLEQPGVDAPGMLAWTIAEEALCRGAERDARQALAALSAMRVPPATELAWFERGLLARIGLVHDLADDFAGARRVELERFRDAERRGDFRAMAGASIDVAIVALRLGDVEAARAWTATAAELDEQAGSSPLRRANVLVTLAELRARTGDADATGTADAALEIAEPRAYTELIARAHGAHLLVALGREEPTEAAARARTLAGLASDAGMGATPEITRLAGEVLSALTLSGDLTAAEAHLARLERLPGLGHRRWLAATIASGRGRIAAAQGELAAAAERLDAAAESFRSLEMPFERARTLIELGRVRRRRREKRRANDTLLEARRLLEAARAEPWLRQVEAELRRVGLRPRAPATLTPTELLVAGLVARGRSNREVAAIASLSPRTVEGVLARVYGKLDVRSRTELAARFPDLAASAPGAAPGNAAPGATDHVVPRLPRGSGRA